MDMHNTQEMRNANRVLVEKINRKRPLGRPMPGGQNNSK
jgi:hypothetical protein